MPVATDAGQWGVQVKRTRHNRSSLQHRHLIDVINGSPPFFCKRHGWSSSMCHGLAIVIIGGSNLGSPARPGAHWQRSSHCPLQHPAPPSVPPVDGWRVSSPYFSSIAMQSCLHKQCVHHKKPQHHHTCSSAPRHRRRRPTGGTSPPRTLLRLAGFEPAIPGGQRLRVASSYATTALGGQNPITSSAVFTEATGKQDKLPQTTLMQPGGWAYGPLTVTIHQNSMLSVQASVLCAETFNLSLPRVRPDECHA